MPPVYIAVPLITVLIFIVAMVKIMLQVLHEDKQKNGKRGDKE